MINHKFIGNFKSHITIGGTQNGHLELLTIGEERLDHLLRSSDPSQFSHVLYLFFFWFSKINNLLGLLFVLYRIFPHIPLGFFG